MHLVDYLVGVCLRIRRRFGLCPGDLRLTAVPSRPRLHCSNPDAQATVKRHIRLLHEYNEMRDVGLGLIGTSVSP